VKVECPTVQLYNCTAKLFNAEVMQDRLFTVNTMSMSTQINLRRIFKILPVCSRKEVFRISGGKKETSGKEKMIALLYK